MKIMSHYCHAVHMPLTNAKLAEATIRTTMMDADLLAGQPAGANTWVRKFPLTVLVDGFMATHPRGAKTSGDQRLRKLYAACDTIKRRQSRTRYYRGNRVSLTNMSSSKIEYLAKMPADGMESHVLVGHRKSLNSLISDGLIYGWYDGPAGSIGTHWLTDDGLRLHKDAIRMIEHRRIKDALNKGTLANPDEDDYRIAMEAIVQFRGHDPKTFVENAKKIVALFEDA